MLHQIDDHAFDWDGDRATNKCGSDQGHTELFAHSNAKPISSAKTQETVAEGQITSASRQFGISNFPDEILCLIMECPVAEWEEVVEPRWAELRAYLDAILTVCRRWRRLALGTPRLFRNIRLFSPSEEPDFEKYYPYQLSVARSGAVPLNVWASDGERLPPNGDPSLISECLQYFASLDRIYRIRSLHLKNIDDWDTPEDSIRAILSSTLPILEVLSLTSFEALSLHNFVAIFSRFPTVQQLVLVACDFKLTDDPGNEERMWVPPVGTGIALLPRLEALHLIHINSTHIQPLLLSLSAPSLVTFDWQGNYFFDDDFPALQTPSEHLINVLSHVRELRIGGVIRSMDIESLLRHTPRVEVLQAYNTVTGYGADLHDLLYTMQGGEQAAGHLAPLLRELSLHLFPVSANALQKFAESRALSKPSQLKSIRFSTEALAQLSQHDLESLRQMLQISEWIPPAKATWTDLNWEHPPYPIPKF